MCVLLCRDCCCGTERKHADVDHAAQEFALRTAAAESGGRVIRTRCLGVCERSNVVVVKTAQTTYWFGGVLSAAETSAVSTFVRNGGVGPAPTELSFNVVPRREATYPLRVRAGQTPGVSTRRATASFPRLLIGGVSSGVGKTTFTIGLCRALRRRGLRVAMFKCGPDYLDPTYHRLASGRTAHNLDSWLMGHDALVDAFARSASSADIALIEGVMGLYDGASPTELTGSSAEIAQILGAPIALVCDAGGMARSVAALAHGFATFEPNVAVRALICNRVGSPAHLELVRLACTRIPVLGGLLEDPSAVLPERHLGLHTADERATEPLLEAWADRVEQQCDVAALLELARSAPPLAAAATSHAFSTSTRCRIAIAKDAAFHFYYDTNLRLLERAGAELVPFSPVDGSELPAVDGIYIGGGYPELQAEALAANSGMHAAIRAHAASEKPIYAECGGLMYLADAIVALDGTRHAMLGLVPGVATMRDKLQALGYVEVETREPTLLGPAGTQFRGHQFRYSSFEGPVEPRRYALRAKRSGQLQVEGYGSGAVLGSYVHAHWASNPAIPEAFVRACLTSPGREV